MLCESLQSTGEYCEIIVLTVFLYLHGQNCMCWLELQNIVYETGIKKCSVVYNIIREICCRLTYS